MDKPPISHNPPPPTLLWASEQSSEGFRVLGDPSKECRSVSMISLCDILPSNVTFSHQTSGPPALMRSYGETRGILGIMSQSLALMLMEQVLPFSHPVEVEASLRRIHFPKISYFGAERSEKKYAGTAPGRKTQKVREDVQGRGHYKDPNTSPAAWSWGFHCPMAGAKSPRV